MTEHMKISGKDRILWFFFPCAEISSTKRVIIIAVLSLLYRSLETPDISAERSLQKHLLLIHSDE